jgi:hypothetical protein
METILENDAKWMALMERAFAAPRYDSYFRRHFELTRTIWNRESYLSPSVVLYGLASHAIPNLLNLRNFSEIRIQEAQKAFAAGHLQQAESLSVNVDTFGDRMVSGSETKIERLIGMSIEGHANRELVALYTSAGRTEDAQKAELHVQQIEERLRGMRGGGPEFDHERYLRKQAYQRRGMLVQGFGGLVVLSGFAAFAGILLLELWPPRSANQTTVWRKTLCWAADFAPITFLVGGGAFF